MSKRPAPTPFGAMLAITDATIVVTGDRGLLMQDDLQVRGLRTARATCNEVVGVIDGNTVSILQDGARVWVSTGFPRHAGAFYTGTTNTIRVAGHPVLATRL